jgi:aminopeptidase N
MTRVTLALVSSILLLGTVRALGNGEAAYHRTVYAPYRFDDTRIRLHFDIARRTIYGDEIVVLRPKYTALRSLPFDSAGIEYERVTVNGNVAAITVDGTEQRVTVNVAHPVAAGTPMVIEFVYRARPQRGLFFILPDSGYPKITPEIWTQGEPTDNRRWFPTWDEPNQKTPSELTVTVPRGWTVVANGYLKAHRTTASSETWNWRSPQPKSTYLIAFAAGPLIKHHTALGRFDVDSFVQPPYADLNALCFGSTKNMVAFYNHLIGIDYPFAKYDQTTAERYDFGGMEDESAALITALALHPAVADVESSCDFVVSHELAQNWWGDDVTMADWSNAWINEGFATYYDELWTQHRYGEAAFEYARYKAQQQYFEETRQYLRPIVDYYYADPLDLFDASGHERPAEILHMLRVMFGDRRFFGALRNYLREYTYRNADTHQFFDSIDRSLHTDLTWFQTQWFYRSDYPHFVVTDRYEPLTRSLTLDVSQQNIGGKPYRVPVVVEAHVDGRIIARSFIASTNHQIVTLAGVTSRPHMVLFDPNDNVLCELSFKKPIPELVYQLRHAKHVGDRERALNQLAAFAAKSTPRDREEAETAVHLAAANDAFYGLRADAVSVAATFRDDDAVAHAFDDPDVRVRLAAERAAPQLGTAATPATLTALRALTNDNDPTVAAAALTAIGSLHAGGAYDLLVSALDRDSLWQAIAVGAIRGLAEYGDVRALPLLRDRTRYGIQDQERAAAAIALAQVAKSSDNPAEALPTLLQLVQNDPISGMRIASARALGLLGDRSAVETLEHVQKTDSQVLVKDAAQAAARILREPSS